MVTIKDFFHHPFIARLRKIPKRVYIGASLMIIVGGYVYFFVVPKSLTLNYAVERSCMRNFTFFPDLSQTIRNDSFALQHEGGFGLWGARLVATRTCVEPSSQPTPGTVVVASAPFGGQLLRSHFSVTTPEPPKVDAAIFDQVIPIGKPLVVQLTQPDVIHNYSLKVGTETAPCIEVDVTAVACDVQDLQLKQGAIYSLELYRQFAGGVSTTIAKKQIHTLTATSIKKSSVKNKQTIYTRPKTLHLITDKSLAHAEVRIAEKGKSNPIGLKTTVEGKDITVQLEKELPREKHFELVVTALEATDGSTLAAPYKLSFYTSGGPKVVGVNIGRSGIDRSATIVVTFDQQLSSDQGLGRLATITGANASVTRRGNQVIYTLQSVPLCRSFTLSIAKGILSKYDIKSDTSWSYTSRTTCHTVSVYGYSVRGSALLAYNFGASGPVTLYVGAIHGNEPSSSSLMQAWISDLEANPSLYSGRRVVVVPTINPDGVASGTRTNARGVNLNRNFPTDNWVKDINDTDGSHKGGGGSKPLSEPEARALANLTTSLRPRLLVSFHAIGSLVVGDPGGYSAGYAARYASMVGYRNATGQGGTFDYDITGAYEDWTYAKQGIPSMVVELGSYSGVSFSYHREAIRAMLR